MFNYFNNDFFFFFVPDIRKTAKYHYLRKDTPLVVGFSKVIKFYVGDVLKIIFFKKTIPLVFEGLCISIKKRSFRDHNMTFILRNVVINVGIELRVSYFYNRAYKMIFLNHKKKLYGKSLTRLYYVRYRLNRESRVSYY